MATASELSAKVSVFISTADKAYALVNGPASGTGSTVVTAAGTLPTFAKQLADAAATFTTNSNAAITTFNASGTSAINTFNTNGNAAIAALNEALTPVSVASNAAKLALTSGQITVGRVVKITGEANRLEMYLGGTINSEANWLVLVNSFQLSVIYEGYGSFVLYKDGSPVTINGGFSTTVLGWVREDAAFSAPSLLVADGYGGFVCSSGIVSIWNSAVTSLKLAGLMLNASNLGSSSSSAGMLAWENFSSVIKGPKRGSLVVQVGYI